MNNKLIKSISSCVLAAMLLSTGAAAQENTQDEQAAITGESTSSAEFYACVEKIKSVYTERYPEQVEVVNRIINKLTSNEVFLGCYEYEGKTAFQILEDALMNALMPSVQPYSYSSGVYFTQYSVPTITQIKDYYCGPAATQMALFGCGLVSTNYDYFRSGALQAEIASKLGTSKEDGTIIAYITNYMNSNYSSSNPFKSMWFDYDSSHDVISYLMYSLENDATPILRVADTKYFNYYGGKSFVHYVTITKIDMIRSTITVVDPHYDSTYGGEHTISFVELYNTSKDDMGLWVSVYTNA